MAHDAVVLPASVVGKTDLIRLRRELDALENYLHQEALRGTKPEEFKLPKTTRMLDDFAQANGLNLLHRADHERITAILDTLMEKAPVMHLSFSVEPSAAFTAKLTAWFRQNVASDSLIQIGLQPNIPAGCMLRTKNKQFDLTLRKRFAENRHLLSDQLHGGVTS